MFFRHATPESPRFHHVRTRFSQLGKYPGIGLELRKDSGPVFEVRDLLLACRRDFDSEIVRTDTVMFRSSCETAPGIGPFRGPCRIQAGFHAPVHPCAPGRAPRLTTTGSAAGTSSMNPARRGGRGDERINEIHIKEH